MITRDQAISVNEFHTKRLGATNAIHHKARACITWRRNGKTQTWNTRPNDFRVPVKFGLFAYGSITREVAGHFYVPEECPFCKDGTK